MAGLPVPAEIVSFIYQSVAIIVYAIAVFLRGWSADTAFIEETLVDCSVAIIIGQVTDFFYRAGICSADDPTGS